MLDLRTREKVAEHPRVATLEPVRYLRKIRLERIDPESVCRGLPSGYSAALKSERRYRIAPPFV
jgi:hypothetical protein